MDRKQFLGQFFKYAAGKGIQAVTENPVVTFLEKFAEPEDTSQEAIKKERPPGAIEESSFQETCTGCDACMIACPVNVIMIEEGDENRLPIIYPEKDPCIHCEDYPCIKACLSSALNSPLTSKL